jgi:AbiV family abortive infection protein
MNDFSIPIPHTELEEGINLSIENAERLIKDAEILYENNRYSSASYLSIVALEEEGKASILLSKLLEHTDISKKYWNEKIASGRSHRKKLIAVQETISNYGKLKMKAGEERWKQVHLTDLAEIFLKHKDDSLYVDWDFETRKTQITGKWKSPLRDMLIEGFPLVDENKRRKTAEGLIYEAKLGLETTRLKVKEKSKTLC